MDICIFILSIAVVFISITNIINRISINKAYEVMGWLLRSVAAKSLADILPEDEKRPHLHVTARGMMQASRYLGWITKKEYDERMKELD